jgi:hypothetical protein
MFRLALRVCPGDDWPWLPQPKTKLFEKPLALAYTQDNSKTNLQKLGQGFAVPVYTTKPYFFWSQS